MKNRDIFLPSLSTLMIAGMITFLSCAHQNRVKDDLDGAQVDGDGTEQSLDAENESLESGSEASDLAIDEGSTSSESVDDLALNDSGSEEKKLEDDLSSLSEETSKETTSASTQDADDLALENDAIESSKTSVDQSKEFTDKNSGLTSTPSDTAELELENGNFDDGLGAPIATNTVPPVEKEIQAEEPPVISDPPVLSSTKEEEIVPSKPSYSGRSWTPTIPKFAVKRKGKSLNRFYFVRRGDTANSVSQLIYGNAGQAKNLKKWNPGWSVGKLVYYSSPIDPNDKSMQSFYQEKQVTPDEYTIQRGDWLSKVAKNKLGNSSSWKEIAVVNGLKRPDAIEVGQKIAIYPKDLTAAMGTAVAQAEQEPQQAANSPVGRQATEPEPVQPPPTEAAVEPPVVAEPPTQAPPQPESAKVSKESSDFDLAKLVEQNMFFGVIAVAVLLLGAAFMMAKKRKVAKESADDFGDEGFQPPTKLKRK